MKKFKYFDFFVIILILIAGTIFSSLPLSGQFLQHRRGAFRSGGAEPITDEGNLFARWTAESGLTHSGDGTGVSAWASTHGSYTLAQATSDDRPLFRANAQNGRPGVEFVSVDYMATGSAVMTFSASQEWTVYVAAKAAATFAGGINPLVGASNTSVDTSYARFALNSSYQVTQGLLGAAGSPDEAVTSTNTSSGAFFIATFQIRDGTASNLDNYVWLNNGGEGSVLSDASIPGSVNQFTLGTILRSSGILGASEEIMLEIRIYDVEHDGTARTTIYDEINGWWNP